MLCFLLNLRVYILRRDAGEPHLTYYSVGKRSKPHKLVILLCVSTCVSAEGKFLPSRSSVFCFLSLL